MQGINQPPQMRKVGLLTDDPALFDGMTIDENISIVLRSMEGKKISARHSTALQEKLHSCLEQFGLDGLGGMYPDELTPLQRYRASFARMMTAKPQIVLLDDPFRNHPEKEFADLQNELAQQLEISGIPVLFAVMADSMEEAHQHLPQRWQKDIGNRIMVLGAGFGEYYESLRIQKTAEMPKIPEKPCAVVCPLPSSAEGEKAKISKIPEQMQDEKLKTSGETQTPCLQNVKVLSADVRLTDAFHAYVPAWQILFCFPGDPKWRKFDPATSSVLIRSDAFRADKEDCTGAYASFSFHFDGATLQDDRYLISFHTGGSQTALTWTIPADDYEEEKIRNLSEIYVAESDIRFEKNP